MKTLFAAILITGALAAGCSKQSQPKDPSTFFKIVAEKIVTVGGGTNYAAILIQPEISKRWDGSYPANARITDAGGLAPEAMTFDKTSFVANGPYTRLNVPIATSTPGEFKVEMTLSFAICDNLGCETFENVPVTIPFEVMGKGQVLKPPEERENADLSFDVIRNPVPPPTPEQIEAATE